MAVIHTTRIISSQRASRMDLLVVPLIQMRILSDYPMPLLCCELNRVRKENCSEHHATASYCRIGIEEPALPGRGGPIVMVRSWRANQPISDSYCISSKGMKVLCPAQRDEAEEKSRRVAESEQRFRATAGLLLKTSTRNRELGALRANTLNGCRKHRFCEKEVYAYRSNT